MFRSPLAHRRRCARAVGPGADAVVEDPEEVQIIVHRKLHFGLAGPGMTSHIGERLAQHVDISSVARTVPTRRSMAPTKRTSGS